MDICSLYILIFLRTYVLQAENQEEMEDWINCLQAAAKHAIYADQKPKPVSGPSKLQVSLELLYLFKDKISVIIVNNLFI